MSFGKNVVIISADRSSSVNIENNKIILIIGKGRTQWLGDTTFTEGVEYSINFTELEKESLILHYSEVKVIYLLMLQKYINSKQNFWTAYPLSLRNISKNFSINDMKETGLVGYVFDFSVDHFSIDGDAIKGIQRCLTNENNV